MDREISLTRQHSDSNEGIIYTLLWAYKALEAKQIPTTSLYKDFLSKNFGKAASLVGKYYSPSLFETEAKAVLKSASELTEAGYNTTSLAILLAMTKVITDSTYKCPAWYGAAQATRKNIPSWVYEFSHSPTCPWLYTFDKSQVSLFGGSHTSELPFVFGNLDNSYLPTGDCNSTSAEWKLGGQMMDLWTAMAENGKPSTKEIDWPQFQNQGKNLTVPGLLFDNSASSGTVNYTGCDLWIQVNAMLSVTNATASGTPTGATGVSTASPSPTQFNGATTRFPNIERYLALTMLLLGLAVF
jgi:para-nitrobenzyl esterase